MIEDYPPYSGDDYLRDKENSDDYKSECVGGEITNELKTSPPCFSIVEMLCVAATFFFIGIGCGSIYTLDTGNTHVEVIEKACPQMQIEADPPIEETHHSILLIK